MRLRSFHGENLNDAMKQVRDALGSNAVIVATRDDEQGGIRVTAALDDLPVETAKKPVVKPAPTAPLEKINYEHDVVEVVAEQMLRHGVSSVLSEEILSVVTHFADHDALIALGAAMDKLFHFSALFDPAKPRPVCLVGPPGAGKTLTAAKIAANRVLNKKGVGVITTDLTRAGAVEQLAAYTRILKLRLFEVENTVGLKDAIESHKPGEFILIDNAGRNPFVASEMEDLKAYLQAVDMEPVLVLPAGLDAMEAGDITRSFMEAGVAKAILTKIDLTRRLGSLLAVGRETGISLCEMSLSPKVTDMLQPMNAVTLARLLLPREIVAQALKKASA
jgi:flagellar biosynthesis protein FlhF